MVFLLLAAAIFSFIHLLNRTVLRPALIPRVGEKGYRGVFALLSLVAVIGLALSYKAAPYIGLYDPPAWGIHVAHTLMLIAFILLAFALSPANATMAGTTDGKAELPPPTGIFRITRHPMLCAFSLWGVAHLFVNGHLAMLVLIASVLAVSLNGMVSIDAKNHARLGGVWDAYAAQTSRLPFLAIIQGRNRFVLGELSLLRVALGGVLFLGALYVHGLADFLNRLV